MISGQPSALATLETCAEELYARAYAADPLPATLIESLRRLPYLADAIKFAARLAAIDGRQLPPAIASLTSDLDPRPFISDVEAIDMLQRGVRCQIEKRRSQESISEYQAAQMAHRLTSCLEAIDRAVPDYGRAREAYAAYQAAQEGERS